MNSRTIEVVRKVFTLLFGIVILLPALGYLINPQQSFDLHEKRKMASFPVYDGSMTGFRDQINRYINDHFGFRANLMNAHSYLEGLAIYLKLSSPDINDVLIGKEGWLYFVGDSGLQDLHRTSYLSQEQLANLGNVLKQRIKAFEDCGIAYLFAVAPDKQTIYPEYLPWGSVDDLKESRLSAVSRYMNSDELLRKHYLSLAPSLESAKKIFPQALYYKTDTHWNTRGSYFAYKTLMQTFSDISQGQLQSSSFDLTQSKIDSSFKGDIDNQAGLQLPDEEPAFPSTMRAEGNSRPWIPQSLLDTSHMDSENYPLYVNDPGAPYPKKILVLSDSFGAFVSAYLGQSFQQVIIYRLQPSVRNDVLADLVRRHHPDYILDMRVERYLNPDEQNWVQDALAHPLHLGFATTPEEKLLDRLSDASWNVTANGASLQSNRPNGEDLTAIPIDRSSPISGSVETVSQPAQGADVVRVSGWVQSTLSRSPCDAVLATLDSFVIAVDQPNLPAKNPVNGTSPGATSPSPDCGFEMALPESVLVHPGQLHFFAAYRDQTQPPTWKLQEIPVSATQQTLPLAEVNVQVHDNRILVVAQ